jgi:hypothetical protein
MPRIEGQIQAGVCGFTTRIDADCADGQMVCITLASDCENVQKLAAALPPQIDAYGELRAGYDGVIHSTVRTAVRACCAGCVVPAGVFKAMQVAAGLNLPQTVSMEFRRCD